MAVATRLVKNIGSDEPPNHHEQSRRLDLRSADSPGQAWQRTKGEYFLERKTTCGGGEPGGLLSDGEGLIDDLLEGFGPGRQCPGAVQEGGSRAKVFVGDVERRQDREADGVT